VTARSSRAQGGPLPHIPVLLAEVIAAISPRDGGIYVDGTFGAGGYSRGLLEAASCTVYGVDRDPVAIEGGAALARAHPGRLHLIEGCYGDMEGLLRDHGVARVQGIAFDLGVSSMQLDSPERGFSFREDGPLDMRMGRSAVTAADVVNTFPEAELADIIHRLGEERFARRIARAIVEARKTAPITGTLQLAAIVRRAAGRAHDGIDPATRTFQALRIFVNDELGEIERGLAAAERLLAPGGRLAVVSFHSLEDRPVKQFLSERSGAAPRPSRHAPEAAERPAPTFRLLFRRAVRPSAAEVARNPRARSARLRAAERTEAPAPLASAKGAAR
jgi:16S rRNA (cytosine1402-N4)-methyltransferase